MICLGVQKQRAHAHPRHQLDAHTDAHLALRPTAALPQEQVDHRDVALLANAVEEEDGAVHMATEEGHHGVAQVVPKEPVIAQEVVGDLEGEQEDKVLVSTGQVEEEEGAGTSPEVGHQDPAGQSVGQQHHEQDHRVEGREDTGGEGAVEKSFHRGTGARRFFLGSEGDQDLPFVRHCGGYKASGSAESPLPLPLPTQDHAEDVTPPCRATSKCKSWHLPAPWQGQLRTQNPLTFWHPHHEEPCHILRCPRRSPGSANPVVPAQLGTLPAAQTGSAPACRCGDARLR